MYCVKCGVELADSEKKCPLCMTPVYYPEMPENPETPYPKNTKIKEEFTQRGKYFVISFLYFIAAVIPLVCDISLHSEITFAGYVLGGLAFSYVLLFLPGWFRRPSPAIFVPIDFFVAGLLLLYINHKTEGNWFLSFAFPVLAGCALIICSVLVLNYYLRAGHLYIFGGALIATGLLTVLIEFLLYKTFESYDKVYWSLYPLIALFLLGMMLIIIAIVKPWKESLKKIFAL